MTAGASDPDDALPWDSEILGQAAPNQQYLGQRLLYRDGEAESLDPLSWRVVKALFVHWLTLLVLSTVGTIVIFAVFAAADLQLAAVLAGVFGFVLSIVLWWGPVWVPISEWKFMLDGKGELATSAFEHSASAFRRRGTPVTPRVQRILLGRGASRDYLYVQDGIFRRLPRRVPVRPRSLRWLDVLVAGLGRALALDRPHSDLPAPHAAWLAASHDPSLRRRQGPSRGDPRRRP